MKLYVEEIRSDYNGFSSVAKLARNANGLCSDIVDLDFSKCDFFDANMVAPLHVVISKIRDKQNKVNICELKRGIEIILKKNQFLRCFNMGVLLDTNQTTLPFKIFNRQAGEQFNDYLDTYMQGKGIPSMSEALTKRFRQSLFEIFLNADIHSGSKSGIFVCGQFFPKLHHLDFTIADAGVGFLENVRKFTRQKSMNSCDAIKWALTEGNTTKTGNQPGGLGLKLIKDFIRLNKGKFQIMSRLGYYEFSSNVLFHEMDHDFPGTCVNIEINTQDTNSYRLKSDIEQ